MTQTLFSKIRIGFLFNHHFLSVLALSIPSVFKQNEKSLFQTNGYEIRVDMQRAEIYSSEEMTYLYAHTLLHIVFKHPFRRKERDMKLWNMACDIVINNILADFKDVGEMPKDELFDEDMRDRCVEEVYATLLKEEQESSNGEGKEQESEAKSIHDEQGRLKAHIYDPAKMDIDEVEDNTTSSGEQERLDGIIIQALTLAQKERNR